MTSFSELKKNRQKHLDSLAEKSRKMNSSGFQEDDRFWKPTVDTDGNAQAIVRFMPAPSGEDAPWVRYWNHWFKGPGGIYSEKSLTTLGKTDPVGELNRLLWSRGDKERARAQKRKLNYVANIYIIADKGDPSNVGSVRLFRFGKQVFDHLDDAMNPKFDDKEPFNPFDLWQGANFRIRVYRSDGFAKYDRCEFDRQGALHDDDAKLEAIWKQCHPLQPFVTEGFKSYDDLRSQLDTVLGGGGTTHEETDETPPLDDFIPPDVGGNPADVGKPMPAPISDEDDAFFAKLRERALAD